MRQRWLLRALWAGTVGLGIVAGLARAYSPTSPLAVPSAGPMVTTIPDGAVWSGEEPVGADCGCGGGGGHHLHRSHLLNWFHDTCGCWSHHNSPGCGSCKSEFNFAFGS